MTRIELDKVGNRYLVSIMGHANYAENGKDIVCAGVSTLALSFYHYCQDLHESNKANLVAETIKDGSFFLIVEAYESDLYPAYLMLKTGLQSIAYTYPDYVVM